jgi:hypothetical protein
LLKLSYSKETQWSSCAFQELFHVCEYSSHNNISPVFVCVNHLYRRYFHFFSGSWSTWES